MRWYQPYFRRQGAVCVNIDLLQIAVDVEVD